MALNSGLGFHSMWGFSPSMDLLNLHQNILMLQQEDGDDGDDHSNNEEEPLNILLIQPSDPRHIIHTITQRCKNDNDNDNDTNNGIKKRSINFFILEEQPEVLARHVLLLHVFLDDIQIRQRAALFLEIFGNSLVQKRTERYIANAGKMLRELIYSDHDNDNDSLLNKLMIFDHLKHRERDELEKVFKSWTTDNEFDVISLRDHRLRGYYGERYDCRQNLIDWDYHSSVKEVASIIHIKQFQEWRMSGIAFEFGDATYSAPNRSMSSYAKGKAKNGRDCGMFKEFQGFWLDVLVGPYISFGVEIDFKSVNNANAKATDNAKQLFDVVNQGSGAQQQRHHTVDVAMYNLLTFMWMTETGQEYQMKKERDIFSGLGEGVDRKESRDESKLTVELLDENIQNGSMDVNANDNVATEMNPISEPEQNISKQKRECVRQSLNGIRIIPLKGSLKSIAQKSKYKNFFNHVQLSQPSAHFLEQGLMKDVLKNKHSHGFSQSTVSVETAEFMFPVAKKMRSEIITKLVDMGTSNNFESINVTSHRDCVSESVLSFRSV